MQVMEQLSIPRWIVGFVVPANYTFNLGSSCLYLWRGAMMRAKTVAVDALSSTIGSTNFDAQSG
jgi:Na+/H+-dicarboxylate symporter